MNTPRQSIIDKLNTQTQFKLSHYEIEFIIENWITTQSQNLLTCALRFNTNSGISADITLNKESIFKPF